MFIWCSDIYSKYLTFETSTNIKYIDKRPAYFPAVTVCNLNKFQRSVVEQHGPLAVDIIRTLHFIPGMPKPLNFTSDLDLEKVKGFNMSELADNATHSVRMIAQCSYAEEAFQCSDYFKLTMTHLGACYTFNSLGTQKLRTFDTYVAGSSNGLQFRCEVDQDDYFEGTLSAGLKVCVSKLLNCNTT